MFIIAHIRPLFANPVTFEQEIPTKCFLKKFTQKPYTFVELAMFLYVCSYILASSANDHLAIISIIIVTQP